MRSAAEREDPLLEVGPQSDGAAQPQPDATRPPQRAPLDRGDGTSEGLV